MSTTPPGAAEVISLMGLVGQLCADTCKAQVLRASKPIWRMKRENCMNSPNLVEHPLAVMRRGCVLQFDYSLTEPVMPDT
jgi:hypothetical protein